MPEPDLAAIRAAARRLAGPGGRHGVTQPTLFPAPQRTPRGRRAQQTAQATTAPAPQTPDRSVLGRTPSLGEPTDPTDAQLGRRYPYVTPRRAREIRREIDEDRRLLGRHTTREDRPC